jgi:hypothetical protein
MNGWALAQGFIFIWVYSVLQWNCMARSINVGVLAFHNFRISGDAIVCRYDKTKTDQAGQNTHPKHLYANPNDPLVCSHLALAVYLATEDARFEETELFFQNPLDCDNTGSARYCSQLTALIQANWERVKAYLRPKHANTHGIRKGSATYATSGTTCPPPIASIANRGEWSLGGVLDLYWHFCEPGDYFLGRVLAGLDPDSSEFVLLPPHWTIDNPMENETIAEAMHLLYATILQKWGSNEEFSVEGLLLRLLPSIIHHEEFLREQIRAFPGHPFSKIAILQRPELLEALKPLVSLEPSGTVLVSTGIPPHVSMQRQLKKVLDLCSNTLEEVKKIAVSVKDAVYGAVEEKALEQGQLTGEKLQEILGAFQSNIVSFVGEKMDELAVLRPPAEQEAEVDADEGGDFAFMDGSDEVVVEEEVVAAGGNGPTRAAAIVRYRTYSHSGRFWHVPKGFQFPLDTTLKQGWRMWLEGLPTHQSQVVTDGETTTRASPIRPFRLLKSKLLPVGPVRSELCLKWQPIFRMMEEAPLLSIPPSNRIDAAFTNQSFDTAVAHLKTRVGYIFDNPNSRHIQWTLGTWSKNVSRSVILKRGTEGDISRLPAETSNNKRRRQPQTGRQASDVTSRRRLRRRGAPRNAYVSAVLPATAAQVAREQHEAATEAATADVEGEVSGVTDREAQEALMALGG